ncbi:MAG TPA: outer membrane protein transport protein [Pirellulales bacterium]|nr:outer membrane protein transport protein [Pirellulales bacterium]
MSGFRCFQPSTGEWFVRIALVACLAALADSRAEAQGVFLTSIGPINQSMGGAATAAPLDSAGALNWNPAAISGLRNSEMEFGIGLVLPSATLSSSISANALGPGFPPVTLSGSGRSDSGAMPVPTIAIAHHVRDSQWTLGLGVYGIGGFSANYPASTTNPILTPQAPFGLGLGRIYSQAQIYQIVPTASYAITEKLSIGFAPTIDMAQIIADPLFLAAPNNANGDAFATYGPGDGTRVSWGAGFQVGVYYITNNFWHFGASYKSQQWFEPFHYNSQDELGRPTVAKINFNLPSITSFGAAYTGINRWLFATDVRYYNYAGAVGFNQSGFNADNSVAGLGWRSVWSVSTGAQFDATQRLALRMGYTYGQNPVPSSMSMYNVASALIIQNWLSIGGSYRLANNVSANFAWTHGFQNQITGPYQSVIGPVPGTSITSTVASEILNAGLTVTY